MTKTKIALYIALIFLAGGVAGAGLRTLWKPEPPRPPVRPREDFANHILNRMKEKLDLSPEQFAQVEPLFRKGLEEVRSIQDRSLKEVQAVIKKNHDEIGQLLRPEQREKLEQMDRERDKWFRERRNRRHGPAGPDGPPPGEPPHEKPHPESSATPLSPVPPGK